MLIFISSWAMCHNAKVLYDSHLNSIYENFSFKISIRNTISNKSIKDFNRNNIITLLKLFTFYFLPEYKFLQTFDYFSFNGIVSVQFLLAE